MASSGTVQASPRLRSAPRRRRPKTQIADFLGLVRPVAACCLSCSWASAPAHHHRSDAPGPAPEAATADGGHADVTGPHLVDAPPPSRPSPRSRRTATGVPGLSSNYPTRRQPPRTAPVVPSATSEGEPRDPPQLPPGDRRRRIFMGAAGVLTAFGVVVASSSATSSGSPACNTRRPSTAVVGALGQGGSDGIVGKIPA